MGINKRWHILGAGAIGSLWATHLTEENTPCTLIINPASWKNYRNKTLTLVDEDTTKTFSSDCVLADNLDQPINNLLITVKANHAINAVDSIKHRVSSRANVLILMNGIGIQQKVAALLPQRNIWIGSTYDGAWTSEPLRVNYAGKGYTWVGSYNCDNARSFIPDTGLDVRVCDNIFTHLWRKVAVNSVINGLTARYRCKNGQLLLSDNIRSRVEKLAAETQSVLDYHQLEFSESVQVMSERAIRATADNKSSTFQDASHNKPTELNWINGFILREAKKAHLKLYEHERLMTELHQMNIQ